MAKLGPLPLGVLSILLYPLDLLCPLSEGILGQVSRICASVPSTCSTLCHSTGISCPSVELTDRTRIDDAMAVSDLKIPIADCKKAFPSSDRYAKVVSKGVLLLKVTQSFRLKPALLAPAPMATEPLRLGR